VAVAVRGKGIGPLSGCSTIAARFFSVQLALFLFFLPMSQQNYQQSPQQPPIKSVSLPQRYPQIVNNPYQNVSSVAGSTDTLQSTLPSASPRPTQIHSYPNHQPSQYQPMSAQENSHHDSRNGRHPKPGKEIYTYHAPWPVYAMDWSKAPTEKGGFRLALGSFIEEHDNKVHGNSRVFLLQMVKVFTNPMESTTASNNYTI
jgi:hypothetical protein